MKTNMLKQIAVLAVVALSSLLASAYKPMLEDGNKWVATFRDTRMGYTLGHEYYKVVGDTLLAGKQSKIIEEWFVPAQGIEQVRYIMELNPYKSHSYLCEEGKKIYGYNSQKGEYELMMDFDSPVGTKFYRSMEHPTFGLLEREYTIAQIDTITFGMNDSFRRVTLKSQITDQPMMASIQSEEDEYFIERTHVWIEGVGSLHSLDFLNSTIDANQYYRSELNVFVPGKVLELCFSASDYRSLPPASIESIVADGAASDDTTVYDLEGRRVTHPVEGQIYIRGGKKFVWKE